MRRSFGRLFILLAAVVPLAMPLAANADSISVTQVITITATVPPMRSIVVNDKGQMTMIYSNTDQNVTPKVYLNKSPGPEKAITPELQTQYNTIITRTKHLDGVAIPVTLPGSGATATGLSKLLGDTVSALTSPQLFW